MGWQINTRLFIIALPANKYTEWTYQINSVLVATSASFNELDSLVGHLNHVAIVISLAEHFIGRIRYLKDNYKQCKRIRLTPKIIRDLHLWLHFLSLAQDGISINLVLERRPDSIFIMDSCEYGIGGFSLKTG